MYSHHEEPIKPQPILPTVPQPKGMAFFFGTWSGRFIIVNTIIFLLLSWDSGDLFSPSEESLIRWGAKDNVLLASGQIWRLVTPVFVHIGLIHYLFNNWALYVLGYQLEFLLKPKWYLLLYFLAGIGGNISSAVFSLGLSAGASGALFGILGAGFFLERTVGAKLSEIGAKRQRASIYTGMVIANIALGFVIPQIDNAAHVGGLFVGIVFTYTLLNLRPNRLLPINRLRGRLSLGFLTCLFLLGLGLSCSSWYMRQRFEMAALESDRLPEKYYYLSQILRLDPTDRESRLMRLRVALIYGDFTVAAKDFELLNQQAVNSETFQDLVTELRSLGAVDGAVWLQRKLQGA